MRTFKDKKGKQWTLDLSISAIKRVKSLAGVDLLAVEPNPLIVLASDLVKLVDTLYAICKPQADAEGVTDEQFGEGLAGDSLQEAVTALEGEYVDFFPNPIDRKNKQAVLDRVHQAVEILGNKTTKKIEAINVVKIVDDAMTGGPSSGTAPESSASTPAA